MQSSSQGTSWSVEELCDRAACTPCQHLCHAAWNGEPCTCKDGCPHLARRDDRMDTHWRVASQHLDVRGSQHVPGTDTQNIPIVAIMSASATNNTRLSAAKQTRPSAETKTCYADVSGPLRRPNPSKRKSTLSSSSHTCFPLSPTRAPLTSRSHLMPTLGPHVRTQTATYAVWSIMGARKREQPQFKPQFDPPAPAPTLRQQQQQHERAHDYHPYHIAITVPEPRQRSRGRLR
jgi:hypothetical protein